MSQDKDISVSLAEHRIMLENIQDSIVRIEQAGIPNGKRRVEAIEGDLKRLFYLSAAMMVALATALGDRVYGLLNIL